MAPKHKLPAAADDGYGDSKRVKAGTSNSELSARIEAAKAAHAAKVAGNAKSEAGSTPAPAADDDDDPLPPSIAALPPDKQAAFRKARKHVSAVTAKNKKADPKGAVQAPSSGRSGQPHNGGSTPRDDHAKPSSAHLDAPLHPALAKLKGTGNQPTSKHLDAPLHPALQKKSSTGTASKDAASKGAYSKGTASEPSLSRLSAPLHPLLAKKMSQKPKQAGQGIHDKTTEGPKFNPYLVDHEVKKEASQDPLYDKTLKTSTGLSGVAASRKRRNFVWNDPGKYTAQGEAIRRQAELQERVRQAAADKRAEETRADRAELGFMVRDVPDLEWWDSALVEGDEYPDTGSSEGQEQLKISGESSIITHHVHHPELRKPPRDAIKFGKEVTRLTKEEQRKKRRNERMKLNKEKQLRVTLGIEAPAPPKLTQKNVMQVMGDEAIADPTAVDMRVKAEVAERLEKHLLANAERSLTSAQRAEKVKGQQAADAARGKTLSAYSIGSLASGKTRAKLMMNIRQHHDLKGLLVTSPVLCILLFEAGDHTTGFFNKLMLNRIDWKHNEEPRGGYDAIDEPEEDSVAKLKRAIENPDYDDDDDAAGEGKGKDQSKPHQLAKRKGARFEWMSEYNPDGELKDLSGNRCHLIFQSDVGVGQFDWFSERDCPTEGEARAALERIKMENMWALGKYFDES